MPKRRRYGLIRIMYLISCAILGAAAAAGAQQRTPVQAPFDVKPMSITLEDVPYPHPVLPVQVFLRQLWEERLIED